MTKMKTKKAVKSRFKVTGKGKLKRGRPGTRHILTKKSSNKKRKLKKAKLVHAGQEKMYKCLMGAC